MSWTEQLNIQKRLTNLESFKSQTIQDLINKQSLIEAILGDLQQKQDVMTTIIKDLNLKTTQIDKSNNILADAVNRLDGQQNLLVQITEKAQSAYNTAQNATTKATEAFNNANKALTDAKTAYDKAISEGKVAWNLAADSLLQLKSNLDKFYSYFKSLASALNTRVETLSTSVTTTITNFNNGINSIVIEINETGTSIKNKDFFQAVGNMYDLTVNLKVFLDNLKADIPNLIKLLFGGFSELSYTLTQLKDSFTVYTKPLK